MGDCTCTLRIFFRSPKATKPNSFRSSLFKSRNTPPSILLAQNTSTISPSSPFSISKAHSLETESEPNSFAIFTELVMVARYLWFHALACDYIIHAAAINLFLNYVCMWISQIHTITAIRTVGFKCPYCPKEYITLTEVLL